MRAGQGLGSFVSSRWLQVAHGVTCCSIRASYMQNNGSLHVLPAETAGAKTLCSSCNEQLSQRIAQYSLWRDKLHFGSSEVQLL